MILFALFFLLGDVYLQSFSHLPSMLCVLIPLPIFIAWIFLKKYFHYSYVLLALSLGFAWSAWYAHTLLAWSLPTELEGKPILVTGLIASLPITNKEETTFEFELSHHHLVRLVWHDCPALHVGDKWQLMVRLKRFHATQNQGEFDFEAWAIQKKLRATGTVIISEKNKFISHKPYRYFINQLRQNLLQKILLQLPGTNTSAWLITLILGEHSNMPQTDWDVLRNTGTNHLMAIAGLHIGLLASYVRYSVAKIWRYFPYLVLRLPAALAGTVAALIAACLYSALAGFSLPTQRACLMLIVFSLGILRKRKINIWHSWALALLIVLIWNPLSILTESFCLSFFTIALIIYGMSGRLTEKGIWWKWGRMQWVIGWGLIPLSLALFQQASFISLIANCIAIPWMGFLILPFCIFAIIFLWVMPFVAHWFLNLADKSLSYLWYFLSSLSQLKIAVWHQAMPNHTLLFISIIGFLLLLLPAGLPGRFLSVIWIAPLIFYKPTKPILGDFTLNVLDVGQGLAVVVQTNRHTLLYDTGPKYRDHFDMGESIVLPYLYSIGVKKIDKLVISHGDLDHIGGAQAILKQLPVKSVMTSVPEALPTISAQYCLSGYTWQWDEVTFTFLYPTPEKLHLKNDSSCVLKIENAKQSILLTGDIEKSAEKDLVTRVPEKLSAAILVAPHHGSKTSGLAAFISRVHPQWVIYATGYRNRYHFPHASIVNAYQQIQAIQLNTVATGTIQFNLQKDKNAVQPELYRVVHKHYWFD
ncbi:MAG: DNA internalization-related competence protein ComEC/Rec2 [Gammaproteobacteria bacterium]|nr:DNA internalization-related competence protein ComEC/Rec2 [Gammaproteobacteria bacterium]